MARQLFIQFQHDLEISSSNNDDSAELQVIWSIYDSLDGLQSKPVLASLSQLEEQLKNEKIAELLTSRFQVIVIVSGESVVLTRVSIPAQQSRYIRQAIPFAVEEQLANDIDTMHFAVSEKLPNNEYVVAIIARDILEHWLDGLASINLIPEYLVPDTLCIPIELDKYTLLYADSDRVLLRTSSYEGFALEQESLGITLDLLLTADETENIEESQQIETSRTISIWVDQAVLDRDRLKFTQLENEIALNGSLEYNVLDNAVFELLCNTWQKQSHQKNINLLQGKYLLKNPKETAWKQWRPLVWVVSIWIILQLLFNVGYAFYANLEADNLYDQEVNLYKEIFPNIKIKQSPRQDMKIKLDTAAGSVESSDFLSLLGIVGAKLQKVDKQQNMLLGYLSYSENQGDLIMDVVAKAVEKLDEFTQSINDEFIQSTNKKGYNATLKSTSQEKSSTKGRIIINKMSSN